MTPLQNQARNLLSSERFQKAREELAKAILDASGSVRGVRPGASDAGARAAYKDTIADFNRKRGRELYYPFLSSGMGSGPFVELIDGSVKYDMITGIGICFFGHTHPALVREMINGLAADVMQGNLEPGVEATELLNAILAGAAPGSRIAHGWLTTCGTMANEIALKIIRQRKYPATKILAFRDCFAGRSTAMQEITDNPGYRQGQPVYGEVYYLPFYDPKDGEKSTEATLARMREHFTRYPGKFAALMIELVQGEGGFNSAPRDFYVRVFEEAKKAGLAIWMDEIQTFGRTGELFAFQTFDLRDYVDVATIAKILQMGAVLYSEEYNPKPGLVAGTFSGSTMSLRTGRRVLELLNEGGFLGKTGRIQVLSERFTTNLRKLSEGSCRGKISEIRAVGGMIAFLPKTGAMTEVKDFLMKLFDLGVVAFYCGHGPYFARLLPPLGAMEEKDVDDVCALIEKALLA